MKKILILFTLFIIRENKVIAQTNVSGLISINTTWTKSGSPYIVTGNIDVDQGITLTVDPGVVVKFDSVYYIYIDGSLNAQGTSSDSIFFTSNNLSPQSGDWVGIKFRATSISNTNIINYCNIKYAQNAIEIDGSSPSISNSLIQYNQTGIYSDWNTGSPKITNNIITNNSVSGIYGFTTGGCDIIGNQITYNGNGIDMPLTANRIDSNIIKHNTNGIWFNSGGSDIISEIIGNNIDSNASYGVYLFAYPLTISNFNNNIITNNNTGLFIFQVKATFSLNKIANNQTGIYISPYYTVYPIEFHDNCILDNAKYNFIDSCQYDINSTNNWWGTTDSLAIDSLIYDFYNDFNLGKVIFSPFLQTTDSACSLMTAIKEITNNKNESLLSIYPNPNMGIFHLSINSKNEISKDIFIYDVFGKQIFQNLQTDKSDLDIDISKNARGVYLVKVVSEGRVSVSRVVFM